MTAKPSTSLTNEGDFQLVYGTPGVKGGGLTVTPQMGRVRVSLGKPVIIPVPPPDPTPDPVPDPPSFPFPSLQAAVNATIPGGQLVVPEGKVFRETVSISRAIDIVGAGKGFAIDGENKRQFAVIGSGPFIGLHKVEWYGHTTPRQQGTADFNDVGRVTLEQCHGHHNDGSMFSLKGGNGHLVTDSEFNHGGQQLYHVESGARNVTFRRSKFHHGNPDRKYSGFDEAGGGKTSNTDGWLVEDCDFWANNGPSLWADIAVKNTVWRRSRVWDSLYAGFMHEISDGLLMEDCVGWNNGVGDGRGWAWPCDVLISSTRNVIVRRNLFGSGSTNALSVIAQARNDLPGQSTGIVITENTILGSKRLAGWYAPDAGNQSLWDSSNGGSANAYEGPDGSRFEYRSQGMNLAGFNATPAEQGGRYLSPAELAAAKARLVP